MNIWKQIRLAGALVCIVAAFTNVLPLTIIGLCLIAIGSIGQIDRLEYQVEELLKKQRGNDEEA